MYTPTRKTNSLATMPNALDPKTLFLGKTTTETIFETSTKKTLAALKARSRQEIRTSGSGRKHRRHGLPSVLLAINTGAVLGASSRTMSPKLGGIARHARILAKKTASELASDLPLRDKLQRILPRLPW
jgi:hypothetical protein